MRTQATTRIIAHHTACKITCSMHQVAQPCDPSKATAENIAKYKAMLAEKTKKKDQRASSKELVADTRKADENDRAERTICSKKQQSRIGSKLMEDEEVDNAIHDFFVGEDIALRKGTRFFQHVS